MSGPRKEKDNEYSIFLLGLRRNISVYNFQGQLRMDHKLGFRGKNHMGMSSLTLKPKEVCSEDPQGVSSSCREGQGHLAERSSGRPLSFSLLVLAVLACIICLHASQWRQITVISIMFAQ